MVRCSIIIPVHNRASLTRQCLNEVLKQLDNNQDEVIVVDDASTDITSHLLADYWDQVRTIRHAQNTGFSGACNDGAAAAAGKYLVFLNNDTIPQVGWLDSLVRYVEARPEVAAVGSKLLFPNNTVQHAGVAISQDHYPRHIYVGFPSDHPAVNKSRRFQIVTASCLLIRREVFQAAEGFDTAFRNGFEDVDLCLRLGQQGHEIHYCHESVLYHYESVSEHRLDHVDYNTKLYLSRWAPRVEPDDLRFYIEDGLLSVTYPDPYAFRLEISPYLAVLAGPNRESEADRLLGIRSRQVFDLLKEQIRRSVDAKEAEFGGDTGKLAAPASPRESPVPVPPSTEPRLVATGVLHRLGEGSSGRVISIVIPVKNGAAQLRTLLPTILAQRAKGSVEIIAVDSGSHDDSISVLREYGATIVSIDPRTFNHGLTRNLGASYAKGEVVVFANQTIVPADRNWLENLVAPLADDPLLAGVCSRVLPHKHSDLLTYKDGMGDLSGSPERSVKEITDWAVYRALSHHELRVLINFHTVSAAVRPQILARIPFKQVATIGEDVLWAKEVLEAGLKIQHEPSSAIFHSHGYSPLEVLRRNVDDGAANRDIVGRQLPESDVLPLIRQLVHSDWQYLEQLAGLSPAELEDWRVNSVIRRTAQTVGQWLGVNQDSLPSTLIAWLSLTNHVVAGNPSQAVSGRAD